MAGIWRYDHSASNRIQAVLPHEDIVDIKAGWSHAAFVSLGGSVLTKEKNIIF
jgi:hypothetical protein